MKNTEWPAAPTLHVGEGEYALSDEADIKEWTNRMAEEIRGAAINLGWKYVIRETALSRSKKFKFIVRARVNWETGDGECDTVELIWLDYSGVSGSAGGPVTKLSDKTV